MLFPDLLKNELLCHTVGCSSYAWASHFTKPSLSTSGQCCRAHAPCSGSPSPSSPKLPSSTQLGQPSCPCLWWHSFQPCTVSSKLILLLLSQTQNPLTYSSGRSSSHLLSYLCYLLPPLFLSQTTCHRFSILDVPALLSPLLLPKLPSLVCLSFQSLLTPVCQSSAYSMTQISQFKYSCITVQYLKNLALLFCSWTLSTKLFHHACAPECCLGVHQLSLLRVPLARRRQEYSKAMVSLAITKNMQKNNCALSPPWKQSGCIFKNQGKNYLKADSYWNKIRPKYLKSQAVSNTLMLFPEL